MRIEQARLDFDRRNRLGMVETIWGEHKTADQIIEILHSLDNSSEVGLVTRVTVEKARQVMDHIHFVDFHSQARCLSMGTPSLTYPELGDVFILTGGTSDLAVAAEADLALRMHGINTKLFLDLGVSGLHRLLDNLEMIRKKAKVVIACAGMEGALPTVLAGLIPQPVIGVPVSVGYGVSAEGRTSLEGMLASCSPGLVVVNIDNGYGAAMAALRIIFANK